MDLYTHGYFHYSTGQVILMYYISMQCSTVQFSAVYYSAVLCSTVQCSEIYCSTVHYSAVHYDSLPYSAVQCITGRCGTVQCSQLQCSARDYFPPRELRDSVFPCESRGIICPVHCTTAGEQAAYYIKLKLLFLPFLYNLKFSLNF